MAIIVNIPSRGTSAKFPDDATPEEIQAALDEAFPRNGQDVAYDLAADPLFYKRMTPDDFTKYEEFNKTKEKPGVMEMITSGVGAIGNIFADGLVSLIQNPEKAPASALEGAARGTLDMKNLIAQSTNPNSILFNFKDLITGSGDSVSRLLQFREAMDAARYREGLATGEEKPILFTSDKLVDPKQAEMFGTFLDATSAIPALKAAGIFGKAAKVGEAVATGAKAAEMAATGASATERAAGATARGIGGTVSGAAEFIQDRAARIGSGVVENVGFTPAEAAVGSRIADTITSSTLTNPAIGGAVGYLLDDTEGLGLGLGVGFGGAVVGRWLKEAGEGSVLAGVKRLGEGLQAYGQELAAGDSRLSALERVAANTTLSPSVTSVARAARYLGGDWVMDTLLHTVEGGITGSAIGAGLGGLSQGEEGFFQGIGGGLAAGALGGGGGRQLAHLTGAVKSQAVANDFAKWIGKQDPVQAQRAAEFVGEMQNKGFDARALLVDADTHAKEAGLRGITFIESVDELPKNADGKPVVPSEKFKGLFVDPQDPAGTKGIYVNAKYLKDAPDTLAHEIAHAIFAKSFTNRISDEFLQPLFGVEVDGKIVAEPTLPRERLNEFAARYSNALDGPDKKKAQEFQNLFKKVNDPATPEAERKSLQAKIDNEYGMNKRAQEFRDLYTKATDPTVPFEERKAAQAEIAEEYASNYAGFMVLGGKGVEYADALLKGKVPKVVSSAFGFLGDLAKQIVASKSLAEGALDPDAGIRSLFYDKSGKRMVNPELEKATENLFKGVGDTEPKVEVPLNETTAKALNLQKTGLVDENNKPKTKYKRNKEMAQMVDNIIADIERLPAAQRRMQIVRNPLLPNYRNLEGPISQAEADIIGKYLNPENRSLLMAFASSIEDGAIPVRNITHLSLSRDKMVATSANALIHTIGINKENGIYIRFLDVGMVRDRLGKLMQEDRFKGLYNSVAEAYDAYMKQYLPNLKDGRVPSAQALAGNDGIDVGAARRNMFYEASGPRQPEAFINQPDAEFVYDKKKKPAFRSYSLAQIIRADVLANQGTTSFNEAGAYARMKQNFSPVDAGDKQAYRNGEGSTVIKGTKGWRAYSPEGKLVGVFDSDTKAMDKLVKTRFSPDETYLKAVKSGDIETAQRMVDDAAKKAGYTVRAYHGTSNEFNTFKPRTAQGWGTGVYFASDRESAEEYGPRVVSAYLKIERPFSETFPNEDESRIEQTNAYKQAQQQYKNNPRFVSEETGKLDWIELYQESGVFAGQLIQDLGYDAVMQEDSAHTQSGSEIVVFNPSQIKSSEPVTRDEQGNVIPLSKRFDIKSPDIRFSPAEREKARLFAYEGEVSSYEFNAKLDKSKAEFEEQVRRNNEELARLKGLGQEIRDRTREIEQQAMQEEKRKAEEGRLRNKEFLDRMKAEEKAAADAQAAAESAARKAAIEQATLDRAGNVEASTFPTGWKILKSVAGAYRLYNPAGMLQGVYRSEQEARKRMAKKVK